MDVQQIIAALIQDVYQPSQLKVANLQLEAQNAAYGGAFFEVNQYQVRFRLAQVTPKKVGQFVAVWEKNATGRNQAYTYIDAPDFLVIHIIDGERRGQFVFPKAILKAQGIYRTASQPGKMGFRVYPSWVTVTSPQAKRTQVWQSAYFVELASQFELTRLSELYLKN